MRRVTLPALILITAALLISTASASQPAARSSLVSRLVPLPDGQANFGFTFRLFDSTDPIWGDTRPFDVRMRDSIQHELAGKAPTFLTVWTPWQHPDQKGKPYVPFNSALGDIAKVQEVIGDQGCSCRRLGLSDRERRGSCPREASVRRTAA